MENLNLKIDAQTLEQCLKTVTHFGSSDYVNICTGAVNTVQWGGGDWVGAIAVGILLLVPIAFVAMFLKIIFE